MIERYTDAFVDYLTRNIRWILPLLMVALAWSMHGYLVSALAASQGQHPLLERIFPLPTWALGVLSLMGLTQAGIRALTIETRSPSVVQAITALMLLGVLVFMVWLVFFK